MAAQMRCTHIPGRLSSLFFFIFLCVVQEWVQAHREWKKRPRPLPCSRNSFDMWAWIDVSYFILCIWAVTQHCWMDSKLDALKFLSIFFFFVTCASSLWLSIHWMLRADLVWPSVHMLDPQVNGCEFLFLDPACVDRVRLKVSVTVSISLLSWPIISSFLIFIFYLWIGQDITKK